MRLVVTRPEPDGTALKAQLIAMGHEVLIQPLIHIEFEPVEDIDPDETQALIATSRNGVRAIALSAALDSARKLPLFAVGPGTAAAARALGFQDVIEGPRDAAALVALIALKAEVNAAPLVYLAGNAKAADVGGELRRLGFHVLEPVVYVARQADHLGEDLCARLSAHEIDGIVLLSQRTARTYARLLMKQDLKATATNVVHFCLSRAVADGLGDLPALHVATADQPNIKEMLALIARTAPQLK